MHRFGEAIILLGSLQIYSPRNIYFDIYFDRGHNWQGGLKGQELSEYDQVQSVPYTDSVAKCHGFDVSIRVKMSAFWGKKVGRTCN